MFYINFDLKSKARLVKVLYITGSIDEDAYFGVINMDTFVKAFFLGNSNDLEAAVVSVGSNQLHEFDKDKIHNLAKPRVVVTEWLVI